jgi:uncharacterized protein involved in exopolysaccharide biosynthesis
MGAGGALGVGECLMFATPKISSGLRREVTPAEIVTILLRRKRPALVAFAAVVGIVLIACAFITPRFEASALLVVGQGALDGPTQSLRKIAESSISLARIAESEEVIRRAAEEVGLARLIGATDSPPTTWRGMTIIGEFLSFPWSNVGHSRREITALDLAMPALSEGLTVRREPNSDIIRISFQHTDAVTAADFANAVAHTFVDRELDLFSLPGAAEFYERQKVTFDQEMQRASDQLEAFETANQTYSIDDEKQLLLGRASDTAAALARTRGSIAEKTGQKETLAAQLRMLKPVTQSPFVSSLVTTLGKVDHLENNVGGATPRSPDEPRLSDPPLLMVRVYQDAMVALFKVNGELTGLDNLQQEQAEELKRLNAQLAALSSREGEFSRLKRALAQASLNSDTSAKRAVEEQISAAANAAKFSMVKVVQKAYAPIKPVFPKYRLVVGLGLIAALAAAVGIALGLDRAFAVEPVTKTDLRASYLPGLDHERLLKTSRKNRSRGSAARRESMLGTGTGV